MAGFDEATFEEREAALAQVTAGLTGKRHAVVVLEDGVDPDDQPYLDVTINDHPYRLILEDHGD
ncbi:MAG: hypothetical protein HOV97_05755 [Nonomuraea sp.]|nr:hypothetical protein [Nonomuraea sp.]